MVERVVELIFKSQDNRKENFKYSAEKHHNLAQHVAEQSAVLLKNDGILPLDKNSNIAVIGEFAKKPRYQGAGSSLINPTMLDSVYDVLKEKGYEFGYAQGYSAKSDKVDDKLIDDAVQTAQSHEIAVIFAGLTDSYESEGFDRTTLDIPYNQIKLIEEVSKVNKNLIIVLSNGAPVAMPWIQNVKALLEGYLHGQAGAGAIVNILYGDICPSGKLAETFPLKLEDNPSYNYFPGYEKTVEYRESIYVGYRYYDKAQKKVLFPFGYGLSYTEFEYSNLKVKKDGNFDYKVSFNIKNTGMCDGAETAQIYVKNNDSAIFKAVKELKGFKKIFLKKGEMQNVELELDKRAFAYYNVKTNDWHVDGGTYGVLVGASSADIRLEDSIKIDGTDDINVPDYSKDIPCYYTLENDVLNIPENDFEKLLGRKLPLRVKSIDEAYDECSTLSEIKHTFAGRILNKYIFKKMKELVPTEKNAEDDTTYVMMYNIAKEMPLKSFGMMAGNSTPPYSAEAIAAMANKKFIKGIKLLLKK